MSKPFSFEDALSEAQPFTDVDKAHLGKFAEVAAPQTYIDGQIITHEGDLGTGLYVITKGSADVVLNHGDADQQTLTELQRGAFFGDMALLRERPRSATVIAKGNTECFVLHRADFKRLTLETPEVLWNMMDDITERLERANDAIAQLAH